MMSEFRNGWSLEVLIDKQKRFRYTLGEWSIFSPLSGSLN